MVGLLVVKLEGKRIVVLVVVVMQILLWEDHAMRTAASSVYVPASATSVVDGVGR